MPFDQPLAQRLENQLSRLLNDKNTEKKKMFGGLCFMHRGHMLCGLMGNKVMVRVGAERYAELLKLPHASKMNFSGKALKGFLFVAPAGTKTSAQLGRWLKICLAYNATLPEKAGSREPYPDSTPLRKVKNFGPVTSKELSSMGIETLAQLRRLGFERACRAYVASFPERLNANAFLGILCTLEDTVWTRATPAQRAAARALAKELRRELGV